MAANIEIVHAYRHLYRSLLKAVQYSMPSRFIALEQLRTAFRERGATFDPRGVKRTIWFLEAAAKERGMEHKILKNLLFVHSRRFSQRKPWYKVQPDMKLPMVERSKTSFHHYDMTIAMLNKTMGLCLR
ncbi:hypothetical protein NM208_g9385 [Fusarium decemcellulare]|uniref:Uncharacterized protein n=1 Tax=Fusarium decemcellulare TaxID=57161 RepID=A0ACC1S1X9_9HYPO|nr:hypothetical protein NM208_g9385 [Fusarium decemcellulare]